MKTLIAIVIGLIGSELFFKGIGFEYRPFSSDFHWQSSLLYFLVYVAFCLVGERLVEKVKTK